MNTEIICNNGQLTWIESGKHNFRVCVKPPIVIRIGDEPFVQFLAEKRAARKRTAFVDAIFNDPVWHFVLAPSVKTADRQFLLG